MVEQFKNLNVEEFSFFLKDPSPEKLIIFSRDDELPRDVLEGALGGFVKEGENSNMSFYKLVFASDDPFPEQVAAELGVYEEPALFYFVGNVCAGRIRGLKPAYPSISVINDNEDHQGGRHWFSTRQVN